MISFCVPTRNRPDIFKAMCLSVLNTVTNPNDIEFVVYRDDDDESIYEYVGNYKEVRGKRIYPGTSINECQKVATGPIYLSVPDDVVFENKGWDEKVNDAFDKSADKIIFVYFNDHYLRSNFGSIGCVHKNWVDAVGYFLSPDLCRGNDIWINEVGRSINRMVYINGVGYKDLRILEDQTHIEYLAEDERSNCTERYNSESMKVARSRDAQLLQNFIDNFKSR